MVADPGPEQANFPPGYGIGNGFGIGGGLMGTYEAAAMAGLRQTNGLPIADNSDSDLGGGNGKRGRMDGQGETPYTRTSQPSAERARSAGMRIPRMYNIGSEEDRGGKRGGTNQCDRFWTKSTSDT